MSKAPNIQRLYFLCTNINRNIYNINNAGKKKKNFKRICYIFASCSAVANEQRAKAVLFSFIAMDKKKCKLN